MCLIFLWAVEVQVSRRSLDTHNWDCNKDITLTYTKMVAGATNVNETI